MATARCCAVHITPHSTCKPSPEGRVKRHLLPFPPAAAENNQGETKSQATQRRSQETVPKGMSNSAHIHTVCTHCFVLSVKLMKSFYPPRCSKTGAVSYWSFEIHLLYFKAIHHSTMWPFKQATTVQCTGDDDRLHHLSYNNLIPYETNPLPRKVIKIHHHFTGL